MIKSGTDLNKPTNKQTNKHPNKQTNKQTPQQTNKQTNTPTNKQTPKSGPINRENEIGISGDTGKCPRPVYKKDFHVQTTTRNTSFKKIPDFRKFGIF